VGDAVAKTTVTVSGSESRENEDDDGYSATMKPTGDCLPPDPRLVEGPREASQLPPLSARPLTAGLLPCPPMRTAPCLPRLNRGSKELWPPGRHPRSVGPVGDKVVERVDLGRGQGVGRGCEAGALHFRC
jgi:hypothetical protein